MQPNTISKAKSHIYKNWLTDHFQRSLSKLLSITLIVVSLLFGSSGYAQRVSLSGHQIGLESLFKQIESQTGLHPFYQDSVLLNTRKVDIEVHDMPIRQALDLCFEKQPLTYEIVKNMIVVRKKLKDAPLLDVHGNISASGNALENASVQVMGSPKGTYTDGNGNFNLQQVRHSDSLIISCVGYQTKVLPVTGPDLKINLDNAITSLDEPIIIGYGITSRRFNTGSVTKVSRQEIVQQPVDNPILALQGRVSGLLIAQTTGMPGGGLQINLRGKNSIAAGNAPFYIIDGVPFPSESSVQVGSGVILEGSPFSLISPQSIESIEVLKDADVTSIFGSRGANGVIIITTTKGKKGRMQANFASSIGIEKVSRTMKLLSTPAYLQMRHEAFLNDGATPDPSVDYDLLTWDTTRNTDWQKELIGKTASLNNNSLSISGGSKVITYLMSGNYRRETTVFPRNFHRIDGSGQGNFSIRSKNGRLSSEVAYLMSNINARYPGADLTDRAFLIPPDAPKGYNPDGSLNWMAGYDNPYAILSQIYLSSNTAYLASSIIKWAPWQGWLFKNSFGINWINVHENEIIPATSINPLFGINTSSSLFGTKKNNLWIAEPQVEYTGRLGFGKLTLLIGTTFQKNNSTSNFLSASGYSRTELLTSLDGAARIDTLSNLSAVYKYSAVYMRARYELNRKFVFNFTGRRDGSSRFGPSKQFANFGAIGIAWIFSEESLIRKKYKWLSFGKIRGSFGITGNDQIGDYQFQSTWASLPYTYTNISGLFPTRPYNSLYGWETTRKSDVGVDINFLKNRIHFSFSYYANQTGSQLLLRPLSAVTGFQQIQDNYPAVVQNKGFEIEVSTVNIVSNYLHWTISLNLTIPKNRLTVFENLSNTVYAKQYQLGKDIGVAPTYHVIGIDQNSGIYKFEDINRDGRVSSPEDLNWNKSFMPKYYGGIYSFISFRNISLEFNVLVVKQAAYSSQILSDQAPGMVGNQPLNILSRWTHPGSNGNLQKFTQNYSSQAYGAFSKFLESDYTISDGSFIRVKSLDFTYNISGQLFKKVGVSGLKAHVQASNVFTITSFGGVDPEIQKNFGYLPTLKSVIVGIEISF